MATPKVTLYVDIVSPFAYMAFYLLHNSPVFKKCEVTYVPIFLGGLMHACGNKTPISITNKDKWINTERIRWASYFKIPISTTAPPNFPVNTLPIQRVLASISLSHPNSLASAISLFYQNLWVHYNEPMKPGNMLAIVSTIVGSDEEARKVMERSTTEEVKNLLTGNTNQAFENGAFGLPWFVGTNSKGQTEGFWGIDHLGQLCDHLGLERPGGKGWRALL